jgi:hypothetical protein
VQERAEDQKRFVAELHALSAHCFAKAGAAATTDASTADAAYAELSARRAGEQVLRRELLEANAAAQRLAEQNASLQARLADGVAQLAAARRQLWTAAASAGGAAGSGAGGSAGVLAGVLCRVCRAMNAC